MWPRRSAVAGLCLVVLSALALAGCGPTQPGWTATSTSPTGGVEPGGPPGSAPPSGPLPGAPIDLFTEDAMCALVTNIDAGALLGTANVTYQSFDLTPQGQVQMLGCRILGLPPSLGVIELRAASSEAANETLAAGVPGGREFRTQEIPYGTVVQWSAYLGVVADGVFLGLEVLGDLSDRADPATEAEVQAEMDKVLTAAGLTTSP